MTADKVIKANECCGSLTPKCNDCPYYLATNDNNDDCITIMRKDTIKLIEHFAKLAEYYKGRRDEWQDKTMYFAKICDKLQEENDRQKEEIQHYRIKEILSKHSDGAALAKLALDISERLKK